MGIIAIIAVQTLRMFLILIITITFSLAAKIPEPCCSKKTVGDLSYTLVNSEDTSIATRYGCISNCVYQQDDSPGSLFCFAVGHLPTNCTDDVSVTASTMPTTTKSALTTEDCPANYVSAEGDIAGWGQIKGRIQTTMKGCSEECNKHEECCSFEYSHSSGLCNLNRDCQPSKEKYLDYNFCIRN